MVPLKSPTDFGTRPAPIQAKDTSNVPVTESKALLATLGWLVGLLCFPAG